MLAGIPRAAVRSPRRPAPSRRDALDPAVADIHLLQDGAQDGPHPECEDPPLQPPPERDLVVVDRCRMPPLEMQVAGWPQVAENIVENTMCQLCVARGVPEHPA